MPLAQLELLTATLAAAEIGGWSLELASQRLCWTAGIFQIHGLTAGEPPSVEATLAYYPPEARAIVKQAMARAAATGESWDLEVPLVTAQNRAIWVRSSGQAIRKDGDIVHLAGALQDVTARHEMMASAERLSELAAQMTNAVIMTDAEGCADWVNDAFTRLTSYTLEDMQGRKPGTLLQGPDTDPQTIRHIQECLQRGEGFDVEILNYTRERQSYWTAIICTPLRSKAGILTGFLSVQSNVTSRRRAEEETRQERRRVEALLRDVLDSLPIAVSVYDPCERLILTNRCFTGTFPVLAQFAVPGATLEDITGSGLRAGQFPQGAGTVEQQQAWLAETLKTMRQGSGIRTLQLSDGRFVQARETRSADGNLICVRTDMTELKRAEVALRVQAEQDALTRLGNRTALVRALERMLKPGLDGACRGGALVMLDVDYFKQVNDSLGHDAGDALLVELASRLRDATRGGDTPARLGGDEFAILFPGLFNDSGAAARMTQIHAALSKPVLFNGQELTVGISAGMTLFPADGHTAEQLLKNADLALYDAKRGGRGRWCRYHPKQAISLEHHEHLAAALRIAIEEDLIDVALQPKRLIRGGHDGFEALARWHDGTRFVPPNEFVPVAEQSGLMVKLGLLVLNKALARIAALRNMGLEPGRVAVNVGGLQLLDSRFQRDVLGALHDHGLEPDSLEFELTESVLLGRSMERVEQTLRTLRTAGVSITLDDFGTGFASLAHVSRLPIQRLKVDRSFTGGIGRGGRDSAIARAVIGLAHGMDMSVTAVGVETREQLDFLRAEGCDAVQGHLIAPPMLHLDDISAFLRAHQEWAPRHLRAVRVGA